MPIPEKDDIVHQRDADGNLLPQQVELETVSTPAKKFLGIPEDEPLEFKMRPAKQGEIAELMQTASQEEDDGGEEEVTSSEISFVTDRLIKPDLDPEDMDYAKSQEIMGSALIALLSISTGTPQEDVAEAIEESMEDVDEEELFQGSDESESEDGEAEEGTGEDSEEE